jgi:hypothetical protein
VAKNNAQQSKQAMRLLSLFSIGASKPMRSGEILVTIFWIAGNIKRRVNKYTNNNENIPMATAVIVLRKKASGTFSNQGAINFCKWVSVMVFLFPCGS